MKLKYLLFLITTILILTNSCNARGTANELYFTGHVSLQNFIPLYFENESYSISLSESKSWGGLDIDVDKSELTVYADRNNTSTPAEWVIRGLDQRAIPWWYDNAYATTPNVSGVSQMFPRLLNFAIFGNLYIKYTDPDYRWYGYYICKNVFIAQGHSGNRNNWWIFNNIASSWKEDYHTLYCTNLGKGVFFKVQGSNTSDVNKFTFTLVN